MNKFNLKLLAVFFFSVALISYELFVMRVFSVGSWSNFGSLVISTALLGFGLAGTLLTFIQKWVRKAPNKWLFICSLVYMPAMVAGFYWAQKIPFTPIFIGSDPTQIIWIGMYYVTYGIPFFIGAMYIGIAFLTLSKSVFKLYFWNMAGSGLGGLFIILFMYFIPPDKLLLPLLLMAFVAALLSAMRRGRDSGKITVKLTELVLASTAFFISTLLVIFLGNIKISEYKSISYAQKYTDTRLVHHSYSPVGEMTVFSSSQFHSAPGLSDNAIIQLKEVPHQKFWGLFIDGNGPIHIMGKFLENEGPYLDYLPMAAPYRVIKKPQVLLVNLNGGISAQLALYNQAREVTVVEPNPEIVRLLKDDKTIREFNNDLLRNPQIKVQINEPRSFCVTHPDAYDLVEISLIDSIGLNDAGGYPVQENYTYTKEALQNYLFSLKSDGILSITVWNRISPPRNVPKILATVVAALKELKMADPGQHLFVFDLLRSTATILVKKSPFTPSEITELRYFTKKRSFDTIYYPGIAKRKLNYVDIMKKYGQAYHNSGGSSTDSGGKGALYSFVKKYLSAYINLNFLEKPEYSTSDFYHLCLVKFLENQQNRVYKDYIFDIRPMTDDRPYYSGYLKLNKLGQYLNKLNEVSEEWGYLMILGIIIQSLFFSAIIILLPLFGRFKELLIKGQNSWQVILYYSCLGLGYMLIEMYLIQRLVFYLSDPIFSASIVITSMLILSGLGSICSRFIKKPREQVIWIAVGGITVSLLFYLLGLTPLLNSTLGTPFAVKFLLTVLIISPAAFFMGMPFPNGLNALSENKENLLPWAWGMNGAFSVTGSVLGRLVSITFGFPLVLVMSILIYLGAGLTFKANLKN